jgi:osmotically-inducible protein OsmY
MTPRTTPENGDVNDDVELEDLPIRDRTYESFGQQGVALSTYGDEPRAHRGAERVDLGEPVADPVAPRPPAGPRGWQRRDDRIHDDVCSHLTDDGYVDASDIEVVVHQGEVTLTGTVTDRGQRDRAIHIAESTRGVVDVVTRVRVRPEPREEPGPRR